MAWINLLLIGLAVTVTQCSRREEVEDVREGHDVTLKCRINNPALLDSGGQIYWMRQRNGEKDNVAIGDTPFDRSYSVDLDKDEGRYDLTISRATYERDNGMFECRVKEAGTGSDLHTTTVNLTVLIPPGSPRINPEAPTATEGQAFDLVCSSQGGSPDPQIIWYRSGSDQRLYSVLKPGGGRDFPTTSVLTINPGKDDDSAEYRCVVWNRALTDDEKMESSVSLSVNYYPRITIGPADPLRVELGQSATLTCSADAKPPVSNVRWTRAGRFIDTRNTLVKESIMQDDAGRYVCQADNGLGTLREEQVTLDVQYGPRVSVISSKDVDEGDDIIINCNVTANPAPFKIDWLKEGDDSFYQKGAVLTLSEVSAADQGNYICRAVNILSPTGAEASNRVGNGTVAVRVRHAPGKTYITPAEPIAVQGEQTTLTCGADPPGWPTPTYRWWRQDSEVTLTLGANYTIPRASLKDEGTYYCQPSNRLGKGATASVRVRVHQPPRILENLPETAIHQITKTDLSLTCRAEGKPQPSIRWLKDGLELKTSDGIYEILIEQSEGQGAATVQSTLHFRGPHRYNDNKLLPTDRGVYECVFKNDVREVSSSQLLRIKHSPITVHKANKVAYDLKEDAKLECRMQAYPQPKFQWSLGPNFIDSTTDMTHYATNDTDLGDDVYASVLTIRGVTQADYGSYTCKGMNTMGDHKTIITLQEKGRPEHPKNLRVITRGADYIELSWEESFNGGFPDTYFHAELETMSGDIISHDCQTQNPCLIQPLPMQTAFKIQIKASNFKGESDFSEPLEAMTLVNVDSIPKPNEVFYERTSHSISYKVPPTNLELQAQVEVRDVETEEWVAMEGPFIPLASDTHGTYSLGEANVNEVRIKFCSLYSEGSCGQYKNAEKVDYLPPLPSQSMSMQYMVAIIVACVVIVALVALVFICCCCRRRNSKLKNKTADMEVSHRGVVTQQAPPPPYYTVGMDNKGLDGSMDTGLDDPSKTGIYSSQQYHNYTQNGHVNTHNNNGMGYVMDNSYSNSNNGGSVNSQDSLWQVKGHAVDPQQQNTQHNQHNQHNQHMAPDPRSYQYDPMVHGGYGITGYDDYSHYPPAAHPSQQGMMEDYPGSQGNYMANGDPYAAVHKQRKRSEHMDGSYDVSGMPDPYMEQHQQEQMGGMENKPQISFDESLESGYSTPNSRNRRIIREIIV